MTTSTTQPNAASTEDRKHRGKFERLLGAIPLGIGPRLAPLFAGNGLKAKSLRGSTWTIAGYGTSQLLRLGSNLILTRLLFPEAFGLMALVNVFLQGLQMLSDIGINSSIIQNEHGDDESFLRTAWTLQIIRGVLLWLGSCIIAYPVSVFFEDPRLFHMIPVAGLTVLILGFQTTALPQHNRHLKLGRLTTLQLAARALNLTVTIILAWQLRSVWALVFGAVLGALVQVTLAQALLPGIKHRLYIKRAYLIDIIRFGKWLFFATALGYLAGHASDKLVLGKLVSKETLGVYAVAFIFAQMPISIVNMLMSRVLYPALSQANRDASHTFEEKLIRARSIIWKPLLVLVGALGFCGPAIIRALWDPRYHAAGWMVQLLAIGIWFGSLNSSLNAALLARGESFASALQNTVYLLVGVPCMIVGYQVYQVPGLILGMVSGSVAAHFALHVLLLRRQLHVYRQDVAAHITATLVALIVIYVHVYSEIIY